MSTPVIDAVMKNSLADVQSALKKGGSIDERWENGSTPLMFAAENGNLEILSFLLEMGANINDVNNDGNTALMFASDKGHFETANFLLKRHADVNTVNKYGNTALLLAANSGYLEIVNLLLNHNVNPRERSAQRRTERSLGRSSGVALSAVNHVDSRGNTALILAVNGGHLEIVNLLLNHNININHVNIHGDTALIRAVHLGYDNIIKILLRYGADMYVVNNYGMSAFNVDKKSYLKNISDNQDVDPDLTPLMVATIKGDEMLLSYYIGKAKGLNATDSEGKTALHYAMINNQIESFKILMESGADLKIKDKDGKTVLDYFRNWGEYLSVIPTDLVRLIIESF